MRYWLEFYLLVARYKIGLAKKDYACEQSPTIHGFENNYIKIRVATDGEKFEQLDAEDNYAKGQKSDDEIMAKNREELRIEEIAWRASQAADEIVRVNLKGWGFHF